ncbi:MAG: dockerin type I domain-containing protein [Candidatus Zixiibacteriota bacterium]
MKEKGTLLVLFVILLLFASSNSAIADDPGDRDTCRVECADITLPDQELVLEVTVYNDEDLGGLAVPLVFGSSPLDVVCDSISFVGSRIESAEYLGASIDTANYALLFYAVFIDSNLDSGDGMVASLYFTTGLDWDSTLCMRIDTTFYSPTTVLEFTPRSSGLALHPEFQAGCLGSGTVSAPELIGPLDEADVCSPYVDLELVWSKAGEDLLYTLEYDQDPGFTSPTMVEDLADTSYGVALARGSYFWHVKAANECGKESPYQEPPFSFYVFASGDATNDGVVDVADVVQVINYLYREDVPPDPPESGDASCDGIINVSDIVWLISYLYKSGPAPCCP